MYWGYFALYSTILHIILLIDLGFCLNKYLDQFETLAYKPVHDRRKREIVGNNGATIDVKFRSQIHNKTFHLKLRPVHQSKNIFDEKHAIDVDGIHHSHIIKPHEFIYEGVLEGDPHSTIYGTLHDGIFDGLITAGDGQTFTVEKASRYFGYDNRPLHYHSILYADQHINHGRFRTKRGDNEPEFSDETVLHGCGLSKKLHEEMRKFQESATEEPMTSRKFSYELDGERLQQLHSEEFLPFPYRYLNRTKRSEKPDWREIRTKRVYEVRTCTIYLQADHKLYEHIFHKEGNRDHIRTREEIVALLYTHIKAVNQIYEGTDFNGIRGINFAIKRTTIYTPETCIGERATTSGNPFCEDNVDVSNYLNMNSQKDHSAFCLAYSLTYRDFIGGTLGLAWVASPSQSTAGGICQKYQRYNEHQRGGVNRSLNTGIITLVNYGNRVPPRVSQLTLAHEIGHNFGSPHDFPLECQPGLPDGNFIMFASATSGDKPNNSKFSRCSVANISEVLFEVLAQSPKGYTPGRKKNCFTDQLKSFCGNQIKEDDEQCDCGFTAQDCQEMGDQCCTPREGASETTMCKRKPGRQCSPSEGLCCNPENCSYFEQHKKRKCREDSECQYEQFCDGRQPGCPQSANKEDGKPCQDNTKVCHSGNCNGSICAHYGLKDCFLTEGKPEDLCQLACEKNGICLPSASLPELAVANLVQEGRSAGHLLLPPGSPCNNYQGYCDIFRKCRSVDSNGPLARLKNLLFNREAIKEFTQLVKENWWACVLIGIVVLMLMALFVKCCAVHTPSTNPNKLPPANFSDTLRHPGTLLRRGHGHGPQHARPASNGHRDRHGRTARAQCAANQVGREGTGNNANMAAATGAPRTARPTANPTNQIAETPLIQIGPAPSIPSAPLANILPSEPPPPYQLTDPAAAAPRPPLQPVAEPSQPPLQQHSSIPAIVGPSNPIAVPLPGAPPPAQPSSSILPLIPGPPHGQGPKPGRRKPKQSPQQQQLQQAKKAKDATGNEKRHNKRQAK